MMMKWNIVLQGDMLSLATTGEKKNFFIEIGKQVTKLQLNFFTTEYTQLDLRLDHKVSSDEIGKKNAAHHGFPFASYFLLFMSQ